MLFFCTFYLSKNGFQNKLSSTTVFNINNNNNKKKRFLSIKLALI